jgi:hypothetical protein
VSRVGLPHAAGLEPILAWRTWGLRREKHGSLRLRPVTGRVGPWEPGEPVHAVCRRRFHRAPRPSCRCGLYASREVELLRRAPDGTVLGSVALWGRVVEHQMGFRGEFAYPQRLGLLCRPCFWLWGPGRAHVDVAVILARGQILPICVGQLEVLARRDDIRIREVVSAADVERELLDTYAVDVLRFADREVVGSQEDLAAS